MFAGFDSLAALARAVRARRVTPTELVAHALDAIARTQPGLNAFIAVTADSARAAARAMEKRLARRADPGLLAGAPLAVKDLLLTVDAPTTAGSRTFGDGLTATQDAEVVARLRRAGAIMVGKANLHEVALGVTTVNEHFGPTRNPWDPTRVSGGSSGGSAVAVAADLVPIAVGTDTRGSIRIPASCCGITGFKPTYGLVSLRGVLPLAPSLDHVGPMARSVEDAALMLAAMLPRGARATALARAPRGATKGLVVGVSTYHLRDMDDAVARAMDDALRHLRPLVRDLVEVQLPAIEGVQEASGVIAGAEAVAYHDQRLREHPEGFGPMVRGRLAGGWERSAVDYIRAQQVQRHVRAAFAAAFQEVDLLVGATMPVVPALIADQRVVVNGAPANTVEASTRFNAPQNMAGLPALSVPCGFAGGVPVGLQVMGPVGGDARVLALGGAWQRATNWHRRTASAC